jgi:hypothetical protein
MHAGFEKGPYWRWVIVGTLSCAELAVRCHAMSVGFMCWRYLQCMFKSSSFHPLTALLKTKVACFDFEFLVFAC